MAGKEKTGNARGAEASQVVRQFAWNIAGSLGGGKAGAGAAGPAKPAGKR
jgi:hypothetical protein